MTELNPSIAGAAGEIISTGSDVNRFYGALVGGRLLRPAQLHDMMTAWPTNDPFGAGYGLGMESIHLSCGGFYWGHAGDIFGFRIRGAATVDGKQVTVMVNEGPSGSKAEGDDFDAAVETALCESA